MKKIMSMIEMMMVALLMMVIHVVTIQKAAAQSNRKIPKELCLETFSFLLSFGGYHADHVYEGGDDDNDGDECTMHYRLSP